MRNPFQSTAWLLVADGSGERRFVGSCFGFRRRNYLLTASHCIRGAPASSIFVSAYGEQRRELPVDEVIHHPNADVALLRLAAPHALADRFAGETSVYDWGVPVAAFGYPEDTGEAGLQPTPRFFRGNLQRMLPYKSHDGYEYDAAELSFGAPGGLSGGPVTPGTDYAMVMGIVVENRTSTTYLSTITEAVTETTSYIERVHAVINYAIVVRLDPLSEWFNQHVPYAGAGV